MTSISNETESTDLSPAPDIGKRIGLEQRLLAEAVRIYEDAHGSIIDEPEADAAARGAGGDLERRVIIRAQSLSMAPALQEAFHQLGNASRLAVAIAIVIAIITGATTARVALGLEVNGAVNFFSVLGSILGVHTITLLVWLILVFMKPSFIRTGSLGGVTLALGRRIAQWLHRDSIHVAVVQAIGSVYARSAVGRWTLSAISHALWLSFLIGALATVIVILSIRHYSFFWETTILSDQSYVVLTRTLAVVPELLGFPTPDAQQVIASRWIRGGDPSFAAREAWSGLLVAGIITYGILPRALLMVLCLLARWQAGARFRLDTTWPGFSRLQPRLMPPAQSLGIIDRNDFVAPKRRKEAADQDYLLPIKREGPTAIMGLEIELPQIEWPPQIQGIDWLDLGLVDSRAERRRALEQIKAAAVTPRLIVVVCSVATTPDRGTQAFIDRLQHATRIPVAIVLTEGQRLRARGHADQVQQRIADWRQLAAGAHVPNERVVEVDIDHLTATSRSNLAALVGGERKAQVSGRHIGQAFAMIVDHIGRWSGQPSASEQAELHRAIAKLYQGERTSWQALLRTKVKEGGNKVDQLKTSADRMVDLLPGRLRQSPKWLAAGALAGAMGCVAAATLVGPAAIAALPAWAGLGAAVSAAAQATTSSWSSAAVTPQSIDLTEAVSSAALFALLLELQGRDEMTITRIIDRVVVEREPPVIDSADAARQWLEVLRHRLDLALASEGLK